ncbi:MAG: hypothetical protein IJZ88_07165 [Clostridia bacterium]|nr:hypothetical protein [Clostridia bacterium]
MKRYIAIFISLIMIILTFSSCGNNNIIIDKEGNEHTAVIEKGELVQDKYGNLIEEVTNSEGNKVTQPFSFPEVYQKNKNTIENAYFVIDVPSGWTYAENLSSFRIQHDSKCAEEGKAMCELSFESSSTGDVEVIFDNAYAKELHLQMIQPDFVTDVKKYETELFGKDVQAYSCKYSSGSTIYYYAFSHAYAAVAIKLIIGDECADKISAEKFITENVTLKVFE